jgi:hypothetical protein
MALKCWALPFLPQLHHTPNELTPEFPRTRKDVLFPFMPLLLTPSVAAAAAAVAVTVVFCRYRHCSLPY